MEQAATDNWIEKGRDSAEYLTRVRYPSNPQRYRQHMVNLGLCLSVTVDQPDHSIRGADNKDRQRTIRGLFGPISRELARNARFAYRHATQYLLYRGHSASKFRRNWSRRMANLMTKGVHDPMTLDHIHPWKRDAEYLRMLTEKAGGPDLLKERTTAEIEHRNKIARDTKEGRFKKIANDSKGAGKDRSINTFGLRTGADRDGAPSSFDTSYDVEEARRRLDDDRKRLKLDQDEA